MGTKATTRSGLALAVIALHLAALYALLALRPPHLDSPRAERPPLIVITLPRLPGPQAAPAAGVPSSAPPVAFPSLATPALPALPGITSNTPDPAAAVLGQYFGCHLQNGPRLTEDKERCAKFMRDLPAGPDLPPTAEEKRLAREFDHAQKVLESPTVIPCLMGGIQLLCVAATLITGGDFIATYADLPNRKSEPIATGMVGRSGKTPGAP